MKNDEMISKESLYHFRCISCDKWWSISDPESQLKKGEPVESWDWHCPWCGKKQKTRRQ